VSPWATGALAAIRAPKNREHKTRYPALGVHPLPAISKRASVEPSKSRHRFLAIDSPYAAFIQTQRMSITWPAKKRRDAVQFKASSHPQR
jgi:hypothetical protein